MFVEIKVIEEHYDDDNFKKRAINEVPNNSGKLGSKQLNDLDNKFRLISTNTQNYPCRKFNNVTVFVTTYLFTDKKELSL